MTQESQRPFPWSGLRSEELGPGGCEPLSLPLGEGGRDGHAVTHRGWWTVGRRSSGSSDHPFPVPASGHSTYAGQAVRVHISLLQQELTESPRLALCGPRQGRCFGSPTHLALKRGVGPDAVVGACFCQPGQAALLSCRGKH